MTQLEQAIYTSARTNESDGYQLVGKSPGVLDIDAQQLAIWCPSHDALVASGPQRSVNFFRLPSGHYCVSQTTAAGQEYSGRTGPRIYTHCLLASPEALARFSNDPFALLNAAVCTGELEPQDVIPREMEPLRLLGKASAVNRHAIEIFCKQASNEALASLVASLLASARLAVDGSECCERTFAAALACIPVECRTEFTFTTGLKHSPRRPFRIMPLGEDDSARLQKRFGIESTNISSPQPVDESDRSEWSSLIAALLASGNLSGISAIMIPPRPGLNLETLDELAQKIGPAMTPRLSDGDESTEKLTVAHAHAPHPRKGETESTAVTAQLPARGAATADLPAEHVEKLETLDDAVYEAIAGKPGALEQLQQLWPTVKTEVDSTSVEESRVQYMEYAMKVWTQQDQASGAPALAMSALDVMCVILDS